MHAFATAGLISPGLPRGLETIPHHHAGPLIRWLMAGAELHPEAGAHVAVHRLDAVDDRGRDYCDVHAHDVPELNLVLPDGELTYDIVLGDETHTVAGPASVLIPAGLPHSANVRSGSGYFVAILLGVDDYAGALATAP
jgi:hypothetical protein